LRFWPSSKSLSASLPTPRLAIAPDMLPWRLLRGPRKSNMTGGADEVFPGSTFREDGPSYHEIWGWKPDEVPLRLCAFDGGSMCFQWVRRFAPCVLRRTEEVGEESTKAGQFDVETHSWANANGKTAQCVTARKSGLDEIPLHTSPAFLCLIF
jgi:hypothetical protein